MISELSRSSAIIRECSRVKETICAMQRVISDFDSHQICLQWQKSAHLPHKLQLYILTNAVVFKKDILENRWLVNEDCTKKVKELSNMYYPIEISASLSMEEKMPHMVEWWTKIHELLIRQNVRKDQLTDAVKESGVMLRDGYKMFFDCLLEHQVPLLIFSAGVGDVLEEVIRQNHVFHPNVHVISNYMDFDHNHEGALTHAAGLGELQGRPNVLLLGDSMGDLRMADGVSEPQNILTVGFLNEQVEERQESFVNSFDVVLVQDETMDVPNAILRYIISETSKTHRKNVEKQK